MKKFLKNKAAGYYIVLADALLALVLAIFFFATYGNSMPNNASGLVPETIGIYLLAGLLIEVVVALVPQFRFIHIGAVVMFGLSLYKEVLIIPNLIADKINNVAYQGGHFGINVAYIVLQFVIVISSIVACFIGLYKNEKDANEDIKINKSLPAIIKTSIGGVVVVAAVLSSTLVSADLKKKAASGSNDTPIEEKFNPITDEIKLAADAYEYDFDPNEVLIKEKAEWDFNNADLTALGVTGVREGHYLVYYFEGSYAEGYQGDYSETYAYLYLWDDGLFAGKSGNTNIKGYWFNSSIAEGTDSETGEDIKDCLNMVSNVNHYDSIITEEAGGFYERQAYLYLRMSWGGDRSIIVSGYKYYPEVALFIDAGDEGKGITYKVGDEFDRNSWVANRVIKNLTYSAVFKASEVKWANPEGMLDSNGRFVAAGEYEITATWNGLTAKQKVVVTEA
ncbi:MAG: hypothetical protein PUA56_05225 [Bacillales bacterium]|nr:hypothetical protein [Bacillales bacterium]